MEVLDSFFGNVCELDLVFNFYKVRFDISLGGGEGNGIDPEADVILAEIWTSRGEWTRSSSSRTKNERGGRTVDVDVI